MKELNLEVKKLESRKTKTKGCITDCPIEGGFVFNGLCLDISMTLCQ